MKHTIPTPKAFLLLNVLLMLFISVLNFSCAKTVQAFKLPEKETLSNTTRIYVIRPSFYGTAITANVFENNSIVGRLGPKGYIAWDTQPGDITLQTGAEFIKVLAQPGKTYYFKVQPKAISFNKSTLYTFSEISEQEAKEQIAKLSPPKEKVVR